MARKKKTDDKKQIIDPAKVGAYIAGAGNVVEQPITSTLETNFMPYAMSVIVSRAIPEIDGFKPSHRKLLFTMYNMGLLTGKLTKSANIVGQTMQLNPHGDSAIYETMVRLSEGNEALLHPFVESKGNFGKAYSKDMAYAASRYTEARLAKISNELFRDIDKDTVDFVDNYDATKKEPTLLPVTFPSVLVNANKGIAVGMASDICSFNLKEVCDTTIAYIHDENCDLFETLKAPDFPTGGQLIYDKAALDKIYETGTGSVKVRAKYSYDKSANCIDIVEIPATTTIEAIIDKVIELSKLKKITEINDIRDETGLQGLKITIDLKRGVDPEKLMLKLFKMTPLEDSFSCNFNILINGSPRVMGVKEIIKEWLNFRLDCVKRKVNFRLKKAQDKLHLLEGLQKILLDIDKAIKIVRETEEESEVVPNLMIGFSIDEIQAEYVADIKLRHLNREYILKRTADIEELREEIEKFQAILKSDSRVKKVIVAELKEVIKKYGVDRKTEIIDIEDEPVYEPSAEIASYPCTAFFTKDGYFKKITPLSLRMGGEQKLKEGDEMMQAVETDNKFEVMFFTDKCQVYKAKINDFSDTKASVLGDFVPAKLDFDAGENPVYMAITDDYKGFMIFVFENGKMAKVEMNQYMTKTNRKKLINAYSDKSPLIGAFYVKEESDILIENINGRKLIVNTSALNAKTSKSTQGVAVMKIRKGHKVSSAKVFAEGDLDNVARYRARTLPASGKLPEEEVEQLTLN